MNPLNAQRFPEMLREHEQKTDKKFEKLDKQILTESTKFQRMLDVTSAQYEKRLDKHLLAQRNEIEQLRGVHTQLTEDYTSKINVVAKDVASSKEDITRLSSKVSTISMYVDKTRNDELRISFWNGEGKVTRAVIPNPPEQIIPTPPDNQSIIEENGVLKVAKSFDSSTFRMSSRSVSAYALQLNDGGTILGQEIQERLHSYDTALTSITDTVDSVIHEMRTRQSFEIATRFDTATPSVEELNSFVTTRLFGKNTVSRATDIPSGVKVKNTFDNRTWIHNRITVDGLTTTSWDALDSTELTIAQNDGTVGFVTGSREQFRGFVDVCGVISINGLEETLTEILKSINTLQTDFAQFKSEVSAKLSK